MEEKTKITINLNDSNYELLKKPKQIENLLYDYYNKNKHFDIIKDLDFDLKGYEDFDFDFKNKIRITINKKLWLLLKKYIREYVLVEQKEEQYQSDIYINILLYNFFKQPYEIDTNKNIVNKINLDKVKQKGESPHTENMTHEEELEILDYAFMLDRKEKFEYFIIEQLCLVDRYIMIRERLDKLKIMKDDLNNKEYQRLCKQRFGLTFKETIDIYKIYLDNVKLKYYNPRYKERNYWK